ncbi:MULTISPECIES: tRNA (N6-threonylcarbamoyladenosine(37)-N6)-methyltransferase TrmO [unclassified Vibrio]|uniref:tRNA (N6-threonylcarbamoyladenosine(37)-N6)-methyltransferase TrmO n=1 Tax=Vibrio sp. HB236076 TaxID=3232307 RepID=A0AB39HHV5_9VIBR|nr:tRNA (N6-threonylcarbamoyladenosine(37)-N6)-methyltransferase TrmO [Vibrio sp. HB161653]MDP5254872.1 tRNA (N6-threonylcarbamoyladenosine(37)-N6)-methyltransferase TrmO [Vibrio sp. HB161653]
MTTQQYSISPIGYLNSPYKEKFAVPRQPNLAPSVRSQIKLCHHVNHPDSVRGLDAFSHLWLLFLFDQNIAAGWKPTVRPPRLGGNQRVGVFASRATFRPNHIGMSVVKFEGIIHVNGQYYVEVSGADLVDNTPIIDIKPYLPYADGIDDAQGGYAPEPPTRFEVVFDMTAQHQLERCGDRDYRRQVISEVLSQDPRPAYKKQHDDKVYSVRLFDWDVKFQFQGNRIAVLSIEDF